jgi:hypothetical protein
LRIREGKHPRLKRFPATVGNEHEHALVPLQLPRWTPSLAVPPRYRRCQSQQQRPESRCRKFPSTRERSLCLRTTRCRWTVVLKSADKSVTCASTARRQLQSARVMSTRSRMTRLRHGIPSSPRPLELGSRYRRESRHLRRDVLVPGDSRQVCSRFCGRPRAKPSTSSIRHDSVHEIRRALSTTP